MAAVAGAGGDDNTPAPWAMAVWERVRPYFRGVALEYGQTSCELVPHDPADAPWTQYAEIPTGVENAVEIDVEAQIGRTATRGHISNVGDGTVILDWVPHTSDSLTGRYRLPPGAALDTSSWGVRRLRIEAPTAEGPGAVQILMQ